MRIDLQLAETAGWRALLTLAQQNAQIFLPEPLEEYVVGLLYRALGSAGSSTGSCTARFARQLVEGTRAEHEDLASVGDHCRSSTDAVCPAYGTASTAQPLSVRSHT